MPRKLTHEEYVSELAIKNPNIEVVGQYVRSNVKILHRCKVDDYEWMVLPSSLLHGKGCPVCSKKKKRTHEEYIIEVEKINPNIEVVGKYTKTRTKILHRCKIDGHEWCAKPADILNGSGCPVCGGSMKKTHDEYVIEVSEVNPEIEVIGEYINGQTKILHHCKIDGHEWMARPSAILMGNGCPMCQRRIVRNRLAKTTEEYIKKLVTINKDVVVLGEYVNAKTQITHKCLICDWEWDVVPESLLCGHGCPQCSKSSKSNGEKNVANWLDKNKIAYKKQKTFTDCKNKCVLRFDFYLPDYNTLIEYNGKQHYEPVDYFGGQETFESQVLKDKIKEEYCKKNNILLFEIPYFKDIDEELLRLNDLITERNVVKEVVV